MEIVWHGHSCFSMKAADKHILIDPFLSGNPVNKKSLGEVCKGITHLLITHGHEDHVGDSIEIAKTYQCPVIGIVELCTWLAFQGVDNLTAMNKGGTVAVDGISVTMVNALHTSAMTGKDGPVYLGEPAGFIFEIDGRKVWHMGDTDAFLDMGLIQKIHGPTIAMIPIGDHFTMGPKGAALVCNEICNFEHIIPMHYGTFGLLTGTAAEFTSLVERGHVHTIDVGRAIEI
jgi:L-ascorbate metabolism protein UlaG (beta-lactamase superfamily)